jgi:hypothetical protein
MRGKITYLVILSVISMLLSGDALGQMIHNMPEPQMSTPPPPPGLPIDFGISALIAAGLGLGIFHLQKKK